MMLAVARATDDLEDRAMPTGRAATTRNFEAQSAISDRPCSVRRRVVFFAPGDRNRSTLALATFFERDPPFGSTRATTLTVPPSPSATRALTFPDASSEPWETCRFTFTDTVPGFTAEAAMRGPASARAPRASSAAMVAASTRLLIVAWLIPVVPRPPARREKP